MHVQSIEVFKVVTKCPLAIFSGRRRRPTLSYQVDAHSNQPNLRRWWKIGSTSIGTEGGESHNFDQNSYLLLMCWGFRSILQVLWCVVFGS